MFLICKLIRNTFLGTYKGHVRDLTFFSLTPKRPQIYCRVGKRICQIYHNYNVETAKIKGVYKTVFSKDVPPEVVKTLIQIYEVRQNLLKNNK